MNRLYSSLAVLALALTASVSFLSAQENAPDSFDQVVDRAIFQENTLLKIMRGEHPVVETYIQDLQRDPDFGTAPHTDHYYLGKLDLANGVTAESFMPKKNPKTHALDVFTHLFSIQYVPRGFAQMLLIDGAGFNRNNYDFEFVRREFLGDVRTFVINVTPKKGADSGRFMGRIWVEDRGFNVVRFNGTYAKPKSGEFYMHFDSWRVNAGPDLWVPFESYSEESALPYAFKLRKLKYKAITKIWGYTTAADRSETEFTNLTVDLPSVKDSSEAESDYSPVDSLRQWEHESEDNVLMRLEKANLLAPPGEVEKILNTVVNNLIVTNDLTITPEVSTRVILTSPLETFSVGHTIVISRGLLDTLPDEASLAAILAHELAHIALGQEFDTKYAFTDRVNFDDKDTTKKLRFSRTSADETAANEKAVEYLEKSPYKDKLNQAGLFLKALQRESNELPSLIKPLFGSSMTDKKEVTRMAALMQRAPELQTTRVDQIAALPLGSRTSLDPWTDKLRMAKVHATPLLSAREKMPFEIAPVYLRLRYETGSEEKIAAADAEPTDADKPAAHPAVQDDARQRPSQAESSGSSDAPVQSAAQKDDQQQVAQP